MAVLQKTVIGVPRRVLAPLTAADILRFEDLHPADCCFCVQVQVEGVHIMVSMRRLWKGE